MLVPSISENQSPAKLAPAVLLASPDAKSILELQTAFDSLGLRVELVGDRQITMAAMSALKTPGILLLDARLPAVANGQLLAAVHESGLRTRCAIALIAEQVSDEWIARLREGAIDDIVLRNSSVMAWKTHVSTMLRGHRLYCELEQLRDSAQVELQRDANAGVFNRDSMLSILFRETDRVQRLRGTLSVMAFGVDDFDHWNEQLGQNVCNWLLREVATRAGRTLRSYDLLGPACKDHFLLALPGCGTVDAVAMAERLRMEVFEEPFEIKPGIGETGHTRQIRLTACFGISSSRGRSPVVVVREAESALAEGKLAGPDQIRCAAELPQTAWHSIKAGFMSPFQDGGLIA